MQCAPDLVRPDIAQRLTDTPLPFYDAFRNLTNYVSIHYLVVPDEATLQELYQKETKALKILEQRTAIRMYVSKIVIHPSTVRGRRFDHDTIEIQWRDPESIRWNATIEADDE